KNVVPSAFKFLAGKRKDESNHVFQKDHRTSCNNCRISKHRKRQDNGHQCASAMEKTPLRKMRSQGSQAAWEKRKVESLAASGDLGKSSLSAVPDLSRLMLPMRSYHHGSPLGPDRILIYARF